MLRRLFGSAMVTALSVVAVSACGGDDDVDFGATGGSAGADAGNGGSSGAGASGGSAGSTGGSAGSTGGSAGSTGGSAGSTGGSAGSAGDGGAKLPLGASCSGDQQCDSGHCADGVCCDSACSGTCQACDTDGACKPIAANTDPGNECGACNVCDGAGACSPVPDGTDPNDDCAVQDPASCGTTGECQSGKCELYDAFTVCEKGSCSVSTLTAKLCDGKGSCGPAGTVSCSPYTCNATLDGCRTSCSSDAHCVAGVQCDVSSGICLANLPNGSQCSGDAQCASGFCTDGVCCDQSCSGFCEACNLAGSVGSCKLVPSGQDPDNECGGSGPCNGSCDGSGGCSWPKSVSCTASGSCSGGKIGPGECNGYGLCVHTQSCPGNYACSSQGNCLGICWNDQYCQKGYHCAGVISGSTPGTCQPGTIANGSACQSEGSCQSGDCSDGFSAADCPAQDLCVQCDQDTDCPSGRCDGCQCADRSKSGGSCDENNDCLSGICQPGGTCQ